MSEADNLPRMLSGRYRLEGTLGHGGMGVVYRGTDLLMKRPIAVKLIRAVDGVDLDDEIAGRFLREAKNTARLQHENIVEVYDLGRTEDGGLYFVMELLAGESLSARLKREGHLSPERTVEIAAQICDALQVAHAAGVVHRDLKPANVMLLARAGTNDFVKVLDFGVSKSFLEQDTQLTHTGMLVGTVDYMAPEQIMGKQVDGRTDVYALGIVLYKMLSGKGPFRDNGVPALIHAHLNTMPKPLIEVAKGIPNALDHVVLRCLAKAPDRRFESMAELARALNSAIAPKSNRLADLEYSVPDESEDKTALLVPSQKRQPHAEKDEEEEFEAEDATIRVDRVFRMAPHEGALPIPAPPPRRAPAAPARTDSPKATHALGARERPLGPLEEKTRIDRPESKPCAMCQTINPSNSRVCRACGVSLMNDDQDAVRARVAPTIRSGQAGPGPGSVAVPVPIAGPGMPPATSGAYAMPMPMGQPPMPPQNAGFPPAQPYMGQPAQPWYPPPPPPPPPPSIWQRFLLWTGLRNR